MMEVMQRHGVRGTVAPNSEVCDAYPRIIKAANDLGWDYMGHCQSNARLLTEIPPKTERAVVLATLDRIEAAVGRRPRGWLGAGIQESWNTLDYLAAGGCSHVADSKAAV